MPILHSIAASVYEQIPLIEQENSDEEYEIEVSGVLENLAEIIFPDFFHVSRVRELLE